MLDTQSIFADAPIISSYSRTDAIDDGQLIDVSATAREAGLLFPVAITRGAWADCVAWSDDDTKRQTYQDEGGRLWDVLYMLRIAIKSQNARARRAGKNEPSDRLLFQFYRVPRGGKGRKPRLTTLRCIIGPGDCPAPVMTILLTDED